MYYRRSPERSSGPGRWAAALVVLLAAACGDDGAEAVDPFAALEGTWRATLFRWQRVDDPDAEPVDLIAQGGVMRLDISSGGEVIMTTREVGAAESEVVLGSGRIVGGRLELDTGGGPSVALDYVLSGDLLRLSGRLVVRPGGIGQEELVDLEATLVRTGS